MALDAFDYSNQRIINLELKSAHERIAYRLLFLAKYYGKERDGIVTIVVPTTYQDIADSISLTRETVNRVILEFIAKKYIKRTTNSLAIINIHGLRTILDNDVV